jgi:hypothetical protein
MNRDVTPPRYSALVVPFDSEIWPDHTTLTQAGPRAGVPIPVDGEGASRFALAARGTQTGDLQVRSQRGGFASRDAEESGAGYVWRDATTVGGTTTYGSWRGWDPPRNVVRFDAPIVAESAAGTIRYAKKPSAVICADGSVLMAVEVRDTSQALPYQIAIWRRSGTSDTWARVTSPYGQTSAPTWDLCPCLVALDSGRIVLYYVLYDSVLSGGAITAWYSDDYGTTWSFVGDGLADTNPAAAISTLTGAQRDGCILLCAFTSGTGDVYQFASTDFGNSLVLVEQWAPSNALLACAVTATPSGFMVLVNGGSGGATGTYAHRIGDAFSPLSASTGVSVRSGTTFTPGLAVACDEAGVVHAYPFQTTFLDPYYSFDDGASWQGYQGPAYTFDYTGSAAFSLDSYCAVAARGQVLILGTYTAGSTTVSGIRSWTLGGYSTVTMPRYGRSFLPKSLQGWPGTWHPVNLPERMGWTRTATPPATIGSIATGALVLTTVAEQEWYSVTPGTTNVAGLHFRCVISVATAAAFGDGLSVLLRLDDAVNRFGARLQWTTTQWRLIDDVSGATIGAAQNYTGTVEILVGINVPAATAATAGSVRTWSRRVDSTSQSGVREFTAGPSSTALTRAATSTGHRIQFGHRAAGTYTSTWYEVAWAYGATSINVQLASGFTSPDDLFARPYASSGSGSYVGSGVSVEARGGPTWLGESWDIERRYDYGIERALTFPSPRQFWKATTNSEIIALLWGTVGTNAYASRGLIAIYLGNCNAETVAVAYRNVGGASWTTLGTADRCVGLGSLAFDQMNKSVRPTTDAGIFLRANEFAGGWFVDVTAGTMKQIVSHPEGRWSSAAPLRTMLHLDGSIGTTTGRTNGKIIPRDTVILVDLSGIDTPAIRLTLAKSSTTDAVQAGVIRVGKVVGLGTRYDWGRTIDLDLDGAELAEARDRTIRSLAAAPPRRIVSVAWADTAIDQTDADRFGDPDYILGGNAAIAGVQSTAYTIEGVAREIEGAVDPIVYLPAIGPVSSLKVLNRRHEMLYGRLTSGVSIENVLGEEGDSELVRIATITLQEEV